MSKLLSYALRIPLYLPFRLADSQDLFLPVTLEPLANSTVYSDFYTKTGNLAATRVSPQFTNTRSISFKQATIGYYAARSVPLVKLSVTSAVGK
jgi:hypothetical protein